MNAICLGSSCSSCSSFGKQGNAQLTYRRCVLFLRDSVCVFFGCILDSVASQQVSYSMTGSLSIANLSKRPCWEQQTPTIFMSNCSSKQLRHSAHVQGNKITHRPQGFPKPKIAQIVNTRELCTTSNNGKEVMFNCVARV